MLDTGATKDPSEQEPLLRVFVEYLMPLLTPYETTVYLFLLNRSSSDPNHRTQIGKRMIARGLGQGVRASNGNYEQISKVLNALQAKGCIKIGETTREGTLYTVILPLEMPAIQERRASESQATEVLDYYVNPILRREIFERDGWICRYCGDSVSEQSSTLDHVTPVSLGGDSSDKNLVVACLLCNSIKSGRTEEEAAVDLLRSIQAKRANFASNQQTIGSSDLGV